MSKINGITVGTPTPRSNFNQTDSKKADYIIGRENIASKEFVEEAIGDVILEASGGIGEIVQTTGESMLAVMSQKAVTEALDNQTDLFASPLWQELNKSSEIFTMQSGVRATENGLSTNASYATYLTEAQAPFSIYFVSETSGNFTMLLYNGEPSASTYVSKSTVSKGDLPTEEAPLYVPKGYTFAICQLRGSAQNFVVKYYCPNDGYHLSDKAHFGDSQKVAINEFVDEKLAPLYEITPTWIEDKYCARLSGKIVDHTNPSADAKFFVTDYTMCRGAKSVSWYCTYNGTDVGYAFYDDNKNVVSTGGNDGSRHIDITVAVPETAYYFVTTSRVKNTEIASGNLYFDFTFESLTKSLVMKSDNPLDYIIKDGGYTKMFRKIGAIGDSLASGCCYDENNAGGDKLEYSWVQFIARDIGAEGFNFSMGGYTTRTWLRDFYNDGGSKREYFQTNPCQAYIIGLGVNDRASATKVSIGSTADVMSDYTQNPDTYYGNYAKIIGYVKSLVPKAKIFVITNPRAEDEYNVAVRYMAETFDNVYLLDFMTYGESKYTNASLGSMWVNAHLTATGYRKTAYEIETYIDYIIRNDFAAFDNLPFILE